MSDLPRLPGWVGSIGRLNGRPTAAQINDFTSTARERTATLAASGALLPIVYGRLNVPGLLFAQGMISGDLVVGFVWCVGEIDAIEAIYINDESVPGGVTVTNYLGTDSQTVDATLASAVPAYNDTMRIPIPGGHRGIAYSVLRIPTGQIDGFPVVRATVRGRKVYDPRTDSTAYSDNPALCMGDLITTPDYGLGMTVSGLDDAADWCDTLLGGVTERCRMALRIADSRAIDPDWLVMLSEYAECWYIHDGDGIKLVPDAPVDLEAVPVITASDEGGIISGSLQIVGEDSTDTPTEMEVRYTAIPTTASEPWDLDYVTQSLPGVNEGEIPRIPTSVSLPGIYRAEEAGNKAVARLNRMQHRVRASWVTTDVGVVRQIGDVVIVDNVVRGVYMPVRIDSVSLVGAGRYAVTGMRYDADHYPSDLVLPEDEGLVPVGAIAMLSGETAPSGWEIYDAADGRYIIGAGGTLDPEDTGGTTTATITGNTTTNGAHSGGVDLRIRLGVGGGNFNVGRDSGWTDAPRGGHLHAIASEITPNPLRRLNALVQKITTDGLSIPPSVQTWGLGGLTVSGMSRVLTHAERLLVAEDTNSITGTSSQTASISTASTNDNHHHFFEPITWSQTSAGGFVRTLYSAQEGGGNHSHTSTASVTPAVKRRRLALYGSGGDYKVVPGIIFMWAGGTLPDDFVLCDGTNGTPDMRDYFVEIAADGNEQTATGDNTVAISGTTNAVGHGHTGPPESVNETDQYVPHSSTETHNHTYNISTAWTPPYYALAFIMYSPAG